MKVIQVVGRSNAGKTTFIKSLIVALSPHGPVGVVKHLGHHGFFIEPGKDTTAYYESNAAISCGVDEEKSVFISQETDSTAPSIPSATPVSGMPSWRVQGRVFPRIVIGDLECEDPARPSVGDVVAALDRFEDYYTMEGLVRELRHDCGVSHAGSILTFSGIIREQMGEKRIDDPAERVQGEIESLPGILGARVYHRRDIVHIAILAEEGQEAFAAAVSAIERLRQELKLPEE